MQKSYRRRRQWVGLLFVAPALLLYGAVILVPAGKTINLSLWQWDGVNTATWRGLANYVDVFTDAILRGSIIHALFLILFFSFLPVLMGLVLAGLLTRRRWRGMAVWRLLFFLPQVMPLVAVGIMWRWMYAPQGIINQVLGWFGITRADGWLGEASTALPALGVVGAWVQTGLCMMLFIAGAGNIDRSLYEAARLDGAGPVREFLTVTLPGLRREIGLALTVTVISALASFDLVFVTTGGGPFYATTVPGLLVYQNLIAGDIGHAAALAVVLSTIVVIAAVLANRVGKTE
ncbi:MAG: sugar ABC transporter permease [Propionibacteriaceae bacterium]|jgi:raffinose/stachyose/melibiose transport system permease protein|nr:sugar ABC transporter permease [Propionibacteriaceae bacterium]